MRVFASVERLLRGVTLPLGATPTTHIFKLPLGVVGPRELDLDTSIENCRRYHWSSWLSQRAFGFAREGVASSSP
jgi:hypothetical protein